MPEGAPSTSASEPTSTPAAGSAALRRTERGRQVITARREALSNVVAELPNAWMGIPGWARWFRRGYRLLRRDLGRLAPPGGR